MLKFRTFCLFLFVFLFSSIAEAKICFLPGVLSGDGCLEESEIAACSGWSRTSPCPSGYQQDTCQKKNTTYYKCYCKGDNIHDLGVKYVCTKDYDSTCGCAKADTECNKNIYKYTESDCKKFNNSKPAGDKCQNYSDMTWHYESCECSESDYPYTCKEDGLDVNPIAPKCENSAGETMYSFCACADGWSSTSCDQNTGGCTAELDSVSNGLSACYRCGVAQCPIDSYKNLYSFFCSVSPGIDTNCTSLGYVYDVDGKCEDGTPGLRCPFGFDYIYCEGESGDCRYDSIASCQSANANSVCGIDVNGCFDIVGCASGYKLSADGRYCSEISCLEEGFKSCPANLEGTEPSCTDSKGTFYTDCITAEKCYDIHEGDTAYGTSRGYCEIVVAESEQQTYLNNGYYAVEKCQPVDANAEKRVRLHLCESDTPDCIGGYSPVKGATSTCLNANDGETKTCGGKTYKTGCKCTDENDGYSDSLCQIAEVTEGMKKGDVVKIGASNYVYTGEVKSGCVGFDKQYGYFTVASSHVNYCQGQSLTDDVLYAGAKDTCNLSKNETCNGNVIATTTDGNYVYCSEFCTSSDTTNNPCEQYDAGLFCNSYEKGSTVSDYEELGVVPGSDNKCSYYASCSNNAYCSKVGYVTPLLPDGYRVCHINSVPEGAKETTCGGRTYYSGCCSAKTGCEVTNSSATLKEKLSAGYYKVGLSGADSGCYYYAACETTTADCAGGISPVAGRVTPEQCASTNGYATSYVDCGGKSYPTKCAAVCNYDKTEADCTAAGKQFKLECVKDDEEGSFRFGQCI